MDGAHVARDADAGVNNADDQRDAEHDHADSPGIPGHFFL